MSRAYLGVSSIELRARGTPPTGGSGDPCVMTPLLIISDDQLEVRPVPGAVVQTDDGLTAGIHPS